MPRFQGDVLDRAFEFGVRVLKMSAQFPAKPGFFRVLDQVPAAATSIAANLQEAQAACSRADFVHGVNIARKEARECWVRLRMLAKCGVLPEAKFAELIAEADALIAILTRIVRTVREGGRGARSPGLLTWSS